MIVGFTGTRIGLILPQRRELTDLFQRGPIVEFHHGDCNGADAIAHDIIREYCERTIIHIHPPIDPKNRAYKKGDYIHPTFPYLVRNRHIVDASDCVVATPKMTSEELRSGTWHAIRYAIETGKRVTIIWPTGKVEVR